ncbi:hypothetical protein PV367_02500 [Streptomyces europaeiscabiei]|uniref:Uncharacterized protein n=1 Tax=Streptomyces europaeiscabiei TaxID=146819 RepID=A0AAJ2PK67_9ACTN|nr:hypothetical protein [Streptomyces europaeiscabiei]MDX3128693.1 hypothetical protein [Streptomyces europaeiscabiei]
MAITYNSSPGHADKVVESITSEGGKVWASRPTRGTWKRSVRRPTAPVDAFGPLDIL